VWDDGYKGVWHLGELTDSTKYTVNVGAYDIENVIPGEDSDDTITIKSLLKNNPVFARIINEVRKSDVVTKITFVCLSGKRFKKALAACHFILGELIPKPTVDIHILTLEDGLQGLHGSEAASVDSLNKARKAAYA
jgi:hypothetical protein